MEETFLSIALSALAQPRRLAIYRALGSAPDGMEAGVLAESVGIAPSLLSHHLAAMVDAGLVGRERRWRTVVYSLVPSAMERLAREFGELLRPATPPSPRSGQGDATGS